MKKAIKILLYVLACAAVIALIGIGIYQKFQSDKTKGANVDYDWSEQIQGTWTSSETEGDYAGEVMILDDATVTMKNGDQVLADQPYEFSADTGHVTSSDGSMAQFDYFEFQVTSFLGHIDGCAGNDSNCMVLFSKSK